MAEQEVSGRGDDLPPPGRIAEVFLAFLRLGLTSFGGPIAHLGYFRSELALRRRWIDEGSYASLVALCQFLPGPASSQVGFSLGVLRGGGLLGGLAAWCGFTLPSAAILLLFALGSTTFEGPAAAGILHGLKLVAVAVVAQAVLGMARTLTPDLRRAAIALLAVFVVTLAAGAAGQLVAIALGALLGAVLCREPPARASAHLIFPVRRGAGIVSLALFAVLLVAPALVDLVYRDQALALFNAFYRSGALVFGGGHVVLPLLQAQVVAPGWTDSQTFLSGYGAAQAVPGPLFTLAAYLGAVVRPWPNGVAGALIALVGVFLPGLLLVYGMLPFWDRIRRDPIAQATMRGANAAVVGVLGAALYDPVWLGAVFSPLDAALALAGFLLLTVWKAPAWAVVAALALAGLAGVLV
ncbi:MAG: chromate efflux transporter [Devosia sp.]